MDWLVLSAIRTPLKPGVNSDAQEGKQFLLHYWNIYLYLPSIHITVTQTSSSEPQAPSTTSKPGSTTKGQGNDGGDNTVGMYICQ